MLDELLRPVIDVPLKAIALRLQRIGVTADQVTLTGGAVGIASAAAIAAGWFTVALLLIASNRVADGADGALARLSGPTDRGGFMDISLDFVFYAAVPLAFAVFDPPGNALAAAVLLSAFLSNGAAFFAFAIIAAKRGEFTHGRQGPKSFVYVAGLAGGTETIIAFVLMTMWPAQFPAIACALAILCFASAGGRLRLGWREFTDRP